MEYLRDGLECHERIFQQLLKIEHHEYQTTLGV